MLEKLQELKERFDEIEEALSSPEIICDTGKYTALLRERKILLPIAQKYAEYTELIKNRNESLELAEDATLEAELRELAKEEYKQLREKVLSCEEELKILLIPRDPDDSRDVIMEIRAGAGGEEAALFAAVLYRMYSMYAASQGYSVELISANETELGGFREISFSLSGEDLYSRMKFESGVHRVQRVPETESQGRIHTSTVTVAVLPEVEDVEIEILPSDIEIDTIKSSGAGGQHINKTESAIRLTHKPSGIVIECQDERSQHKNRDKAMKLLKSKLYSMKRQEQEDMIASERRSQVGTGDRSERIRTYNYPQNRVTDHRIGLTLYTLDSFLNGNISPVIDALVTADTARKLKGDIT
jgi:peptide chain release factor 1